MQRILIILFLFTFFNSSSQDVYREGNKKGQYYFHGQTHSVFVDSNAISFVYYSNLNPVHDNLGTVTRVDLILDNVSVSPGNPVKTETINRNGLKKQQSLFEEIKVSNLPSEMILSGSGLSVDSFNKDLELNFSGASAIVQRGEELFFLVKDVLYPLPIRFRNAKDIAELPLIVNLPVIKGEMNMSHRWSTFIGGSVDDDIQSVTKSGNLVYVCGSTLSSDLPASTGSYQDTLGGYYDCYVSCFTREGQKRWTTYLGGSNLEVANSLANDLQGNLIVAGYTNSPDFPVAGSGSTVMNGSYDGFISKFDSTGNLMYSGFFGGSAGDFIYAIANDKFGNLYIGGGTTSQDLPVSGSSAQPNHAGAIDAYVAKFNQSLQLKWCTYMGGAGSEDMHAMTTDLSSSVVFCGGTFSIDFPTENPFQQFTSGGADVYITKLDSTGSIVFSTYFGGTGHDDAYGIVTDSNQTIYIAGFTPSTDLAFQGNAYQVVNYGGFDNFIIKLTSTGEFITGTYYGGSTDDQLVDLAYGNSKLFLAGFTSSIDLPLNINAEQPFLDGILDAYFAVFDTSLGFIAASYFGGEGTERTYSIEHDSLSSFYLAGKSSSLYLPFLNFGDQQVNNGGEEGFLVRLDYLNEPIGLSKQSASKKVLIFPQPATDQLNVKGVDAIDSFEIYDVTGKELMIRRINPSSIDISKLSRGTYMLILQYVNGERSNHYFVKE